MSYTIDTVDAIIYAAYYIGYSILGFYILWIFYLAVMNLARVKKTVGLNKPSIILGTPVLIIGYVLDFLLNVLVLTVILFELPRETTVTARLKRINRDPRAYRWRKAVVGFVEPLVDPYDPTGDHI